MKKSLVEEFPSVINRIYQLYKLYPNVEDVVSRNPVTIDPTATMLEAGRVMGERHIGSLLVEDKGRTVGMVTERDLLSKVIAKRRRPEHVMVKEIMSTYLVTIKPIASVREAARKMIKEKGRLVVLEEGKAVGIVTASDLVKKLPALEVELKVDDAMTPKVTTLDVESSIEVAAGLMDRERIGSVITTQGGRVVGIFTERDLLTKVIAAGVPLNTKVGSVASSPLITIPSGTPINQAAKFMSEKHIRRLPVAAADGNVIGIVTARDLVEAYAR
ncbi:MAG: CBS domain-containing protein [Candidatus Bathyarchaeia archaeon]